MEVAEGGLEGGGLEEGGLEERGLEIGHRVAKASEGTGRVTNSDQQRVA